MTGSTWIPLVVMASAVALTSACSDDAPSQPPSPRSGSRLVVPSGTPTVIAAPSQEVAKKPPRDCGTGPDVVFDDPTMEAAIRLQTSTPEGPVAKQKLSDVKTLKVSDAKKNDDLDPCIIPELKHVKGMYLAPGRLEDITLLRGLTNLESLRLSITRVKDLKPLADLKKLDRIDLGRTPVSDLGPLAGLENLTELMLDDTEVTDLTPLAGLLKLELLSIRNTRVVDLTPLKGLTALKSLDIGGSLVKDITPVAGLARLKIKQ